MDSLLRRYFFNERKPIFWAVIASELFIRNVGKNMVFVFQNRLGEISHIVNLISLMMTLMFLSVGQALDGQALDSQPGSGWPSRPWMARLWMASQAVVQCRAYPPAPEPPRTSLSCGRLSKALLRSVLVPRWWSVASTDAPASQQKDNNLQRHELFFLKPVSGSLNLVRDFLDEDVLILQLLI